MEIQITVLQFSIYPETAYLYIFLLLLKCSSVVTFKELTQKLIRALINRIKQIHKSHLFETFSVSYQYSP